MNVNWRVNDLKHRHHCAGDRNAFTSSSGELSDLINHEALNTTKTDTLILQVNGDRSHYRLRTYLAPSTTIADGSRRNLSHLEPELFYRHVNYSPTPSIAKATCGESSSEYLKSHRNSSNKKGRRHSVPRPCQFNNCKFVC